MIDWILFQYFKVIYPILIQLLFVSFWAEFRRSDGISIDDSSEYPMDLQFDGSNRFWITYENGEVKVGLQGNNDPLVHYIDNDDGSKIKEIDYIQLYSKTQTQTVWTFYEPCTI